MKEYYEKPELEIVELMAEDIVRTSESNDPSDINESQIVPL